MSANSSTRRIPSGLTPYLGRTTLACNSETGLFSDSGLGVKDRLVRFRPPERSNS